MDVQNYVYFILLVCVPSVTSQLKKCPTGSYQYPPADESSNPQSCYLFVNSDYVKQLQAKGSKFEPGVISRANHRLLGETLTVQVWDPDHARNVCRDFQSLPEFSHQFPQIYPFRLPIIESRQEHTWLKDMMQKDAKLGYSMWIDAEWDSNDQDNIFWATTGQSAVWTPPDPDQADPAWEENNVQDGDPDNIARTCFVFQMNYGGKNLEGWLPRACAQAFNRMSTVEKCLDSDANIVFEGFYGPDPPKASQTLTKIIAPTAAVCELPWHPEKTAPPRRTPPGPKRSRPPRKPRTSSSGYKTGPGSLIGWLCVFICGIKIF